MAPPRKHETGHILDAARDVVLRDGPRATSVAAIATASGAPVGSLYHRFGSRDRLLQDAWLRALSRFQERALAASRHADPLEAAVGMAVAAVTFARLHPDCARLITEVRPRDLLDSGSDPVFEGRLAEMNAPLEAALTHITRALRGRADARAREAVLAAVVDLPGAAVRRHARSRKAPPRWLEESVAAATRRLLAD